MEIGTREAIRGWAFAPLHGPGSRNERKGETMLADTYGPQRVQSVPSSSIAGLVFTGSGMTGAGARTPDGIALIYNLNTKLDRNGKKLAGSGVSSRSSGEGRRQDRDSTVRVDQPGSLSFGCLTGRLRCSFLREPFKTLSKLDVRSLDDGD